MSIVCSNNIEAILKQPTRVLKSTKGVMVETPLTDAHALQICKEQTTHKFAQELCAKSQKYSLTESQLVYAHKIALHSLWFDLGYQDCADFIEPRYQDKSYLEGWYAKDADLRDTWGDKDWLN